MNTFQIIQPSAMLNSFIKQYWFLSMKNVTGSSQRVMPFGYPVLTFYRNDPNASLKNEIHLSQPLLHGITTHYTDIFFSGNIDFIGIVFQATTTGMFFQFPLSELNNNFVPRDMSRDAELSELKYQLYNTKDNLKRVEIIESFLIRRLYCLNKEEDKRISTVINSIYNGENDMDRLAHTACLSYKQFKRIFIYHTGINPKKFLQIIRFQKLHHLFQQQTRTTLSQLAFECGYYDKSHLIRELKSLSGFTPSGFLRACDPVYSGYHTLFRLAFVDLPSE